jgi:hypothetical protein
MTTGKKTAPGPAKKLKLKKETLSDLDVSKKSGQVKGGARDPKPQVSQRIGCTGSRYC